MPKLIFIGGAPGIGKTTIARKLFERLEHSAWLEGDDVWRMNPFTVNEHTKQMVERNIQFVLRSYLTAGFAYVLFSWVLHHQSIIDRILEGLEGIKYELFTFTLVCDEPALVSRFEKEVSRGDITELPITRLRQSRVMGTNKIDTTNREPEDIVEEIIQAIEGTT